MKLKSCKIKLSNRELKNVLDTSFEDGEKTGELKKAKEIAKGMLAEKLPLELILKLTGLSEAEIEKL